MLGEGCGSPGRPRSSRAAPRRGPGPIAALPPSAVPTRGGGRGRPTAAESIGTHFPVYLREGEEGRETLLSVAIVNPNNNNKEKSLQLDAG